MTSIKRADDILLTVKEDTDTSVDEKEDRHHHLFHHKAKEGKSKEQEDARLSAEATAMKQALYSIAALFGKLHLEISFAKKEIAYGKLCPEDFDKIISYLRNILLPVVGMTTFIDIMESVKQRNLAAEELMESSETMDAVRRLRSEEWDEVFTMSQDQFKAFHQAIQGGLTHISYVLELEKRPKAPATDVEKQGKPMSPSSAIAMVRADDPIVTRPNTRRS